MPIGLWIAAGVMAAPQTDAGLNRSIFSYYPVEAISRSQSGAVNVRVWVDPGGKVYRCEVLQLVGNEAFRAAGCKAFQGQIIQHAVAPDGTASYGAITNFIRYTTKGHTERQVRALQDPADVVLARGQGAPDFKVVAQVQPDGSVSDCASAEETATDLVEQACAEAKRLGRPVGTDEAGNAVSYVSTLLVRVTAGPA